MRERLAPSIMELGSNSLVISQAFVVFIINTRLSLYDLLFIICLTEPTIPASRRPGEIIRPAEPHLQNGQQTHDLRVFAALARRPPLDLERALRARLLEEEARLGGRLAGGVAGDHAGAVAQPLLDPLALAQGRLVVGDLDGVLGARGVVDGDEGALGQGVGLDGRDDDVGGGAAPVGDYTMSVSLLLSLSRISLSCFLVWGISAKKNKRGMGREGNVLV